MIGYGVKQDILNNEEQIKEKSSIGKLIELKGLEIV